MLTYNEVRQSVIDRLNQDTVRYAGCESQREAAKHGILLATLCILLEKHPEVYEEMKKSGML